MSTKDLYQELILDHGNSPKNRKQLDSFNKESQKSVYSILNIHLSNKI